MTRGVLARPLRFVMALAALRVMPACGQDEAAAPQRTQGQQASEVSVTRSSSPTTAESEPDPTSTAPCGKVGLPDCPLQAWMKATLQANLKAGDFTRLADALDQLARKEPSGFAGWATSARNAGAAARRQDAESVRGVCKGCHDRFRSKFRAEMRGKQLL